jgi:hypothetical protein
VASPIWQVRPDSIETREVSIELKAYIRSEQYGSLFAPETTKLADHPCSRFVDTLRFLFGRGALFRSSAIFKFKNPLWVAVPDSTVKGYLTYLGSISPAPSIDPANSAFP